MTNEKKAELWDYYHEFVLVHGAKSITELVVQRDDLRSVMKSEAAFILRERCSDDIDDGAAERLRKCACRIIDASRKYQPSTKADKGEME